MHSQPLVSIVIPVYKTEKYLVASVDSALRQTYDNTEIILVDDGSPDNCPRICDDFADKNRNVSVIHKKNGGLSDARNAGMRAATGEYLLFLDSDDKLFPDAVERMVEKALKRNADIVIPDRYVEKHEDSGRERVKFHFNKESFSENPKQFALEIIIGQGRAGRATAVLYRSSLLCNKMEFPVGYTDEDIPFNLNCMAVAGKLAVHGKSTLNCLKRPASITTSFQEKSAETCLFLDRCVSAFLDAAGFSDEYGHCRRRQFLCRNTIVFVTSVFSPRCPWPKEKRGEEVRKFLGNERVHDAFRVDYIAPYFNGLMPTLYFKMMFWLLKKSWYGPAFALADFVSKRKRRALTS